MFDLDQAGAGVRVLRTFPPPRELLPFVENSVIVDRSQAAGTACDTWRIVPDGSPHLLVHFFRARDGTVRKVRMGVVGARSVFADADIRHRAATVGVRLRPGTLPLLCGTRADALTDVGASAGELFGADGEELCRRVAERPQPGAARRELLRFVSRRLAEGPRVSWQVRAVTALAEHSRGPSVEILAHHVGVGERTLRNTLRSEVGLTPKQFLRVRRVQRALELKLFAGTPDWASVAIAAGYCDQAHLIKEFRALLGETPRRFLQRRDSTPFG